MDKIFFNQYIESSLSSDAFISKLTDREDSLYEEYLNYCEKTNYNQRLYEEDMSEGFKDVIIFIQDLAHEIRYSVKDLMILIKDRLVFHFFNELNWDINNLFDVVKTGYKAWSNFMSIITNLLTELAKAGLNITKNSRVGEFTAKHIKIIKDFLNRLPAVRRISSIALAGILIIIWLNMSFTDSFGDDFNFSDVVNAIAGKIDIIDFFTSDVGLKVLILLGTGLLEISFAWFTTPVNIAIAVIVTIAKQMRIRLSKT